MLHTTNFIPAIILVQLFFLIIHMPGMIHHRGAINIKAVLFVFLNIININ